MVQSCGNFKLVFIDTVIAGANYEYYNLEFSSHQLVTSRYPDWLWNLEKPGPSYGELSLMFVHGHKIEESTL